MHSTRSSHITVFHWQEFESTNSDRHLPLFDTNGATTASHWPARRGAAAQSQGYLMVMLWWKWQRIGNARDVQLHGTVHTRSAVSTMQWGQQWQLISTDKSMYALHRKARTAISHSTEPLQTTSFAEICSHRAQTNTRCAGQAEPLIEECFCAVFFHMFFCLILCKMYKNDHYFMNIFAAECAGNIFNKFMASLMPTTMATPHWLPAHTPSDRQTCVCVGLYSAEKQ